jgi:hypothetical protein
MGSSSIRFPCHSSPRTNEHEHTYRSPQTQTQDAEDRTHHTAHVFMYHWSRRDVNQMYLPILTRVRQSGGGLMP